MHWHLSHRADQTVRPIADRHYNRQKIGSTHFVPPGRCMVLYAERVARNGDLKGQAFWITSWPFAEYVRHAWGGAWVCSAFRNEGVALSSVMIREAIACTRAKYPEVPEKGMITFVDMKKVRDKKDPGYCYLKAGFMPCGFTKGGLLAYQLLPHEMPNAAEPLPSITREIPSLIT